MDRSNELLIHLFDTPKIIRVKIEFQDDQYYIVGDHFYMDDVLIFIGCASPAGLSYCFFSIGALGCISTIRFEPIEQRPLLANNNRYNRLKKCLSNQEWSIRINT